MKNVINTIRVETTPFESGVGETMLPGQFTPGLKSTQAGSQSSVLLEYFAPARPTAGKVPRVRVDPEGFEPYLTTAENLRRPSRATGWLAHVSPFESGPVRMEWGDEWVGKVAFHPPVQDEVKQ